MAGNDDFDWDEFAKRAGALMDEWRSCHSEVCALLREDFPELVKKLNDLYAYGSTGKE